MHSSISSGSAPKSREREREGRNELELTLEVSHSDGLESDDGLLFDVPALGLLSPDRNLTSVLGSIDDGDFSFHDLRKTETKAESSSQVASRLKSRRKRRRKERLGTYNRVRLLRSDASQLSSSSDDSDDV